MKKLVKIIDMLNSIINEIEEKQEKLREKIDNLDKKACEYDRHFTRGEETRLLNYLKGIDDLESVKKELQTAIDDIEYLDI